jgi:hypothetical protein
VQGVRNYILFFWTVKLMDKSTWFDYAQVIERGEFGGWLCAEQII